MRTLRLTQSIVSPDRFRVEAALEGEHLFRQIATADFDFPVTPQDREELRWYLEDYLQHVADPAPKIAARIEGRISEMGTDLFKAIFYANDDARDLWGMLRDSLNDTRVETVTTVREATGLPWELLRDPKTDAPLALRARAFVRASYQAAQRPHLPQGSTGPIRILLVICRPCGGDDVPFRSVASRLIKGLNQRAREAFQLEVLRPPTFAQLGKVLRVAKAEGNPYHIVHFDGHGAYVEAPPTGGVPEFLSPFSRLMLSTPRTGSHGYLVFENPELEDNHQLVDGPTLGKLLVETDASVLVLNACRSAHAEAPPKPAQADASVNVDVHAQVRALGSLAQEVVDAGVAGVVAMRYNVYVVTAAQFVADLYESLAGGQSLGEAVTLGRKQLEAQPLREIAYTPRPLQDWMVPIVYEAAPVTLFPKPMQRVELKITVSADAAAPASVSFASEVKKVPDAGFFGRDETLLALDRAFDTQSIVLLHAYAGSGKTSTAAEFARWYHLTGGIKGDVLFTSFEQYKPLAQALNEAIGPAFGNKLERKNIHWLALSDEARRDVALQVLSQHPVLWILDNVEPIAGFPAGMPSAWNAAEQQALADFLRDARSTKAKFLLTSRRDERGWLGDLPVRIKVPPMPMQERIQLARALAMKHGRRISDVEDWMPLLRFTEGNPLTVTVLVGEALRDGLKTKKQIAGFVSRLRTGEKVFADEDSEGRSRSLGASLNYGFQHAFTDVERKLLALLYLFQGFVNVDALGTMGNSKNPASLSIVRDLGREGSIAILDRAAEIGLLTAMGDGCYSIHPALPVVFRQMFAQHYGECELRPVRAFAEAIGQWARYLWVQYEQGERDAVNSIAKEEANLLHARQLGRQHGWWEPVMGAMQGLGVLYVHTRRITEWSRLVGEIIPEVVDSKTDGALPGREEEWSRVTSYRVQLARRALQWSEAERLQRLHLEWERKRAAHDLTLPPNTLTLEQRYVIRDLAVSLEHFGQVLFDQGKGEALDAFREDFDLCMRINDRTGAAIAAFNAGRCYRSLQVIADPSKAAMWFIDAQDLAETGDSMLKSQCLAELGGIAYDRFKEALAAGQPQSEFHNYLDTALDFYQKALSLHPKSATGLLATTHHQIGVIFVAANDPNSALPHYAESLRLKENERDEYGAGKTRYNIARALGMLGRFSDAKDYACTAVDNFTSYGVAAAEELQQTRALLVEIERHLQEKKN